MKYILLAAIIFISGCVGTDPTSTNSTYSYEGINITWYGHASFQIKGETITYIDPFILPENPEKADYILMTHDHKDHCAIENAKKLQVRNGTFFEQTHIISTYDCVIKMDGRTNSLDSGEFLSHPTGFSVEVFDAYNIDKKNENGELYHTKGFGNGYLLTIDGVTIYHAGDTDVITEMIQLNNKVDILLLPIGGKFTMTAEEAKDAIKIINPKVVIPMHFNSDEYGIKGLDVNIKNLDLKNMVLLEPAV